MPDLVPTFGTTGSGSATVGYMCSQFDAPWDGPGPGLEMQSVAGQFHRSVMFFNGYIQVPGSHERIALLASALVFGTSCSEKIEAAVEKGIVPNDELKILKKLPYRNLLNHLRNHEMHSISLPSIDGDYWFGETTLSGTATLQLVEGRPRKWQRNGRINTKKPLLICVRNGQVFAFDESKCKCVNVEYALREFMGELAKLVSRLVPEGHKMWSSRSGDGGATQGP